MVNNGRSSVNDNRDIRNSNSGTSQTSCHEECNKDSASGELEYEKDEKNRRISITKDSPYKSIFLEEPQMQTQINVTLKCQKEIMSDQPRIPSPPPQPSWTSEHWLKPGEMSTQSQQPATNDMSKAFIMKQKATQMQKKLNNILSKPAEMSKAERMMQKMGWSGGALGKTGLGIVEPIAPNFIYANASCGLGLSLEKPVKVKEPKPEKNKTEAPSSSIETSYETAATNAAEGTSTHHHPSGQFQTVPVFRYLPPVENVDAMSKYLRMAEELEMGKMQRQQHKAAKRTLKEKAQKPPRPSKSTSTFHHLSGQSQLLPEPRLPIYNVVTMADKIKKADKRKEIRDKYSTAPTFRTRTLNTLLDFVKNDNEIEIVIGSNLRPYQRMLVYQLVNVFIPDNSGQPFGYGFYLTSYTDMVMKIRESNNFILKAQSYGEGDNRMLHISKKAPSHVLLITPDDLREKTKEKNMDLSSVVCDINEINISNREDENDDKYNDEINESDLESDEDYYIVGNITNKEPKEKNSNVSSVVSDNNDSNISDSKVENDDKINENDLESDEDYNVVGNRTNKEQNEKEINLNSVVSQSNISGRDDDKDKKFENDDKQVIVKKELHTVQQTKDKIRDTKTQDLLEEKAKKNPVTTNCEKKSTGDVARSPSKKKLSVAEQLSLSWAEKGRTQSENKVTVSENNQCDTGKSDNVRLKELNLQNTKKEGTEIESQIKCDKDCRESDVTEKLKEFFNAFTRNETYKEIRFLGPFLDDEIQKINDLVTVVLDFFQTNLIKDDRFKNEAFMESLDQLCHSDFTLGITQNDNGNPLIRKHKIGRNSQKNVV